MLVAVMAIGFQRRCRKSNDQAALTLLSRIANSGSEKRKLFRCLRFRDAQQALLSYSRGIRRTLRKSKSRQLTRSTIIQIGYRSGTYWKLSKAVNLTAVIRHDAITQHPERATKLGIIEEEAVIIVKTSRSFR